MSAGAASDQPVRCIDWRELVSISGTTTVRQAAAEMMTNGVSALVVVDDSRSPGLMTERDITRAVAERADLDRSTAADVAQSRPVTADADDQVERVARRLLQEGIRHVPVVRDDEIVTVLSMRDLLGVLVGTDAPGTRLDDRHGADEEQRP